MKSVCFYLEMDNIVLNERSSLDAIIGGILVNQYAKVYGQPTNEEAALAINEANSLFKMIEHDDVSFPAVSDIILLNPQPMPMVVTRHPGRNETIRLGKLDTDEPFGKYTADRLITTNTIPRVSVTGAVFMAQTDDPERICEILRSVPSIGSHRKSCGRIISVSYEEVDTDNEWFGIASADDPTIMRRVPVGFAEQYGMDYVHCLYGRCVAPYVPAIIARNGYQEMEVAYPFVMDVASYTDALDMAV